MDAGFCACRCARRASREVKLADLHLRPEALEDLDLPVDIKWGRLGSLELTLSWSGLTTKPIWVRIDEIFLLATPGT